jgi:murein DD-endopeptidase MepM/ murein hydrolase activator NlpD
LLLQRQLDSRQLPAGRPVDSGWMSSVYGQRPDPFSGKMGWHAGVDFAGHAGVDILAVADGVVSWSGSRYGYGELVEVDHGNGYRTRYAHNQENLVAIGARVRKGDVIARMGSSGRATAPNVHFEVLLNGRHVNPAKYVRVLN